MVNSMFPLDAGLTPGQNISLVKETPDLRAVSLAVEWDAPASVTAPAVIAVLCDPDGAAHNGDGLAFANQPVSADGSTEHFRGDGRGERVEIDLEVVPHDVERVLLLLHSPMVGARQGLGRLRSCRVRVADLDSGAAVISTQNLAPEMHEETVALLAEVYRRNGEWKFRALGQGYGEASVTEVLQRLGVAL